MPSVITHITVNGESIAVAVSGRKAVAYWGGELMAQATRTGETWDAQAQVGGYIYSNHTARQALYRALQDVV